MRLSRAILGPPVMWLGMGLVALAAALDGPQEAIVITAFVGMALISIGIGMVVGGTTS